MIGALLRFVLSQRLIVVALGIALVGAGLYAFGKLKIEAYPDISDTQAVVISLYPGHAAEEVEQQVTAPIERALNNVPNVIARRSRTIFGLSVVELTFADPTDDYFARQVALEKLRDVSLPVGVTPSRYKVSWGGMFENLERARRRLAFILPVTLALIFALLFSAFGSTSDALLALVNVPFSLVGGVIALYLRGINLSVSAAVGFISLSGIAVMSGLLYISEINRRRSELGEPLEEAVVFGARSQMRPRLILITVAMLGMIPAAIATGIGSDVQRPLATVVVGGLLSTLFLTLLALPSLYYLVESRRLNRHGESNDDAPITPDQTDVETQPEGETRE